MNAEVYAAERDAVAEQGADGAPHAPARGTRLRVGVMLDGWVDRAWVAGIVANIQTSDEARVVTVIMNRAPRVSRWRRLWQLLPVGLFLLYSRLDRWLMRRLLRVRSDAFDPVDLRPLLAGAACIEVTPQQGKFTDRFDPAALEQVQAQRLDVILRFGFRILRGPVLEAARFGVWSFHHGDNREYRGGPPMFWEMYEGNPVCGVTLQLLTDQLDGGKALHRTSERTNFFSLYLNQNRGYRKAADSVALRLRTLHDRGWPALAALDSYTECPAYAKPIYKLPRNLTMLAFLAQIVGRSARRAIIELFTVEQWFVAWRRRTPGVTSPHEGEPFQVFRPPAGRSYADPFPVEHEGRHFLFIEHYHHATNRGDISWVEVDQRGRASAPQVAISSDCHLSYPCVFCHENTWYMIPETRARRRVELWRAERFPDRWSLDRVLLDNVSAVDATWLEHEGRYWLFVGVSPEGSSISPQLNLYYATAPLGPWRPHADNPVVTTILGARPAGRPFVHEGQLIRPGQDCAEAYGRRVRLYRVERLNEIEYRETEVDTIEPDWLPGNVGTHTYNFDSQFEVIDGRLRVWRRPWARKPSGGDS